ncbi:MAG TPA: hypothetical protein PK431_11870 [Chitinophagales bacterium]|nr:hypothetical protein [Chitinophagales bacterium]
MSKSIFLMSFFIVAFNYTSFAEENWKLEKNKDGIKIWTRKPANSNLKEYQGNAIIQTSVDKLVAIFKNPKTYQKWMYKIPEGGIKVIKKVNDNDFYVQIIMSAPLIKSRESLVHLTILPADDKGCVLVNMEGAPTLLPPNDNYVRIEKMKAFWKFVPLPNGKVEVTHQALSSVGGNIPDAFVNLAIADAPFSMISKLKEMVK